MIHLKLFKSEYEALIMLPFNFWNLKVEGKLIPMQPCVMKAMFMEVPAIEKKVFGVSKKIVNSKKPISISLTYFQAFTLVELLKVYPCGFDEIYMNNLRNLVINYLNVQL